MTIHATIAAYPLPAHPMLVAFDNSVPAPLSITYFTSATEPAGRRQPFTWPDLWNWIETNAPTAATKKELPLIKLATFADDYRLDANLEAIFGIEGDYDGEILQPDATAELLKAAGIAAFIYTSPSHHPDKPRWRVFCPLSQPCAPAARHGHVARLNGVLGGFLAPESFTASQAFFVGSVTGGHPVQCWRVEGRCIDTVEGLQPIGSTPRKEGTGGGRLYKAGEGKRAPSYKIALDALYSIHPSDPDRNKWLVMSGAFFIATYGLPGAENAFNDWQTWNLQHGDKNNPKDNATTWADFERNGADGDFHTLADMSDGATASAKAWRWFGGIVHQLPPGASATPIPSTVQPTQPMQMPVLSGITPSITTAEWNDISALTPACIVENMYFADVGVRIAPGGVGKTTLALWEAISIALSGNTLFGSRVFRHGTTCILTSEDGRAMLVQRIRKMCEAMNLNDQQKAHVMQSIRIQYVDFFKLTMIANELVIPSQGVQQVIDAFGPSKPHMIFIDPAVSFGVGEHRVNDAEQGLIVAARLIRNAIPDCCVMFIHHSGKANAREKTLDQYSGRGGSAFADGARMVQVMQSLNATDWQSHTGDILQPGESAIILARPKLSHCAPQQPIFIKRQGWTFNVFNEQGNKPGNNAEIVFDWIVQKRRNREYPSQQSLTVMKHEINMPEKDLREAISLLKSKLRLAVEITPGSMDGRNKYLQPKNGHGEDVN